MKRWVETQRLLSSILVLLGKITEAQTHTIGATLNYAIENADEMAADYSAALAAVRSAREMIKAEAERMEKSVLAEISSQLGEPDGD